MFIKHSQKLKYFKFKVLTGWVFVEKNTSKKCLIHVEETTSYGMKIVFSFYSHHYFPTASSLKNTPVNHPPGATFLTWGYYPLEVGSLCHFS